MNKVGAFLVHPSIKRFLIDNTDNLSIRKCMDEQKIVLINISKGAIGADVAHIIGSLLLTAITSSAFSRIDTPKNLRKPFFVYLDEFQNYSNKTITEQLSELRKFNISLVLANQYLDQLNSDIRHALLGNMGSIICFRIGAIDAAHMLKELYLEYGPMTAGDYVNLPNYHVYMRLMIDGKPSKPFSATTLHYKYVI